MPFFEGYLTGLALIVLMGPVFFVLLQTTLERGRAQGLAAVAGILVSDILAVLLCVFGVAGVVQERWMQLLVALGGGLLLLGLGLRSLLGPSVNGPAQTMGPATGLAGAFLRGFGVNFVNPFVFMVWLGIIGLASVRHGFDLDLAVFLAGTILGIVTLDVTKVLLAHRIRPHLQPRVLRILFRVSGVVLVGFGLRLLAAGIG